MVNQGNKEIDLMVLGEVLVKHYLYLQTRTDQKKDFLDEITQRFYVSPATKFGDEIKTFKDVIEGSSTMYNDALLFVMAVCADLVTPELYFDKMLKQYNQLIGSFNSNDTLKVVLKKEQHFECIFFSLRFFIDQLDLIVPPSAEEPGENKEED